MAGEGGAFSRMTHASARAAPRARGSVVATPFHNEHASARTGPRARMTPLIMQGQNEHASARAGPRTDRLSALATVANEHASARTGLQTGVTLHNELGNNEHAPARTARRRLTPPPSMSLQSLTLQAGSGSLDGSTDPKTGISALRIKCWAPDLITAISGAAPDAGAGLVENQPRTYSRSEAGDIGGFDVNITLEGHLTPEKADGAEYSLDGTTSEDDIRSHPEFILLDRLYGDGQDHDGKPFFPAQLQDENGVEFRNPMAGVDSYLVPGLVWTKKWVSKKLPPELAKTLGTIEMPPGNPPPLNGRRVWIKTRCRASWRGNVWEIEESWLLTGPYGVAPELYRASL